MATAPRTPESEAPMDEQTIDLLLSNISQAGRRLVQEHGIDLLDAVDVHALRKLAPAQALQLEAIEQARSGRVRAARAGRP